MRKIIVSMLLAGGAIIQTAPAAAQATGPAAGGLHVGVIGGLDIIRPGSTEDSDVSGDDQSTEGALYGVDAGFDIPLGGIVLGIEGEWSNSTGKTRAGRRDPNFFGYGEVSTGRDLYVGGRLGFAVSPATMVYAKGGYTNSRLNVVASNGDFEAKDRFRLDGYQIGAGVEQSIGRSSYAKIEYRYSNYTEADFRLATGATTNTFEVDTDRHQVVAGVGVRF